MYKPDELCVKEDGGRFRPVKAAHNHGTGSKQLAVETHIGWVLVADGTPLYLKHSKKPLGTYRSKGKRDNDDGFIHTEGYDDDMSPPEKKRLGSSDFRKIEKRYDAEKAHARYQEDQRIWQKSMETYSVEKARTDAVIARQTTLARKGGRLVLAGTAGIIAISFTSGLLPVFATIVLSILAVLLMLGGIAARGNAAKEIGQARPKNEEASARLDGLWLNQPIEPLPLPKEDDTP